VQGLLVAVGPEGGVRDGVRPRVREGPHHLEQDPPVGVGVGPGQDQADVPERVERVEERREGVGAGGSSASVTGW
jgi:hypothetical protein